MDHSLDQHEHVITIPPTRNTSSIASSSIDFEVDSKNLNLPSIAPREGVPTNVLTSRIANIQSWSSTPGRLSRVWNYLCSWSALVFYRICIKIIFLGVFLSIFPNEHPHWTLLVWAIAYGLVCLTSLPLIYFTYKYSRDDLVFQGLEVSEFEMHQHERSREILSNLWEHVNCHFVLWFLFGIGAVSASWIRKEASHLSSLCIAFIVFDFVRFALPRTINCLCDHCDCTSWLQRATASEIAALPTFKFHTQVPDLEANQAANNDGGGRDSIASGGDSRAGAPAAAVAAVVECCICLDAYEEGVELKLLRCVHHFHVKCIDRWLRINGSCPICKFEV